MESSTDKDTLMIWFQQDELKAIRALGAPQIYISVVDDGGIESQLIPSPNARRTLNWGKITGPSGTAGFAPPVIISGWQLPSYPRRAKDFRIRIYDVVGYGRDRAQGVGEFSIQNPTAKNYSILPVEPLPTTRQTNGVEITLTKFETGVTSKRTGLGPAGTESKCFSRATFQFKENRMASEKWSVYGIRATSLGGEVSPGGSFNPRWMHGEHVVDFNGGLWLEEPAWAIHVEIARTGDFPTNELWTVTNILIPDNGEIAERREVATRSGREFEFLGVSGPNAALRDQFTGIRPHANFHLRTPFPVTEWHLSLVEIKDDRGREVHRRGVSSAPSIVGGATVKHLLYGFAFDIPDDAKTLNVAFAITPSRHVQFVAKPTLFSE
jgi:hypothetical protein